MTRKDIAVYILVLLSMGFCMGYSFAMYRSSNLVEKRMNKLTENVLEKLQELK